MPYFFIIFLFFFLRFFQRSASLLHLGDEAAIDTFSTLLQQFSQGFAAFHLTSQTKPPAVISLNNLCKESVSTVPFQPFFQKFSQQPLLHHFCCKKNKQKLLPLASKPHQKPNKNTNKTQKHFKTLNPKKQNTQKPTENPKEKQLRFVSSTPRTSRSFDPRPPRASWAEEAMGGFCGFFLEEKRKENHPTFGEPTKKETIYSKHKISKTLSIRTCVTYDLGRHFFGCL